MFDFLYLKIYNIYVNHELRFSIDIAELGSIFHGYYTSFALFTLNQIIMKLFETRIPQQGNIIILCSSCECYYEVPDKFNSRHCFKCNSPVTNDISGDLRHDLIKKKKACHPRNFSSYLKVELDICRLKKSK